MFLSIVCTFGYSWSLPFQVTIKKNRGHTMPENIRFASSEHFDALWSGNTLKRRSRHYTLDFHTKVQVWGKSHSVTLQVPTIQRSILISRRCQPWLAWKKIEVKKKYKKERDIKKRKKRKEKNKERKKERKEEGKSGRESATFTQNSIRSWLHTLKVAHAWIQSRNSSLPFQAFAALLNTPSPQQFPDIHHICWR